MDQRERMNDVTTTVQATCPMCRTTITIEADTAGVEAWQTGTMIQEALPDLTAAEREVLMSGICPTCWDLLGDDDE